MHGRDRGAVGHVEREGADFGALPGAQYFTLEIPVPVRRESWGRLSSRSR